ncbi:J domain-containing protein [Caballeronia insecticola]|uniref:Heat shock protein DnaJ domain protein n=1 Tax=Caballeronia insecticola TaxID=758793 RepID=R4WK35_9BURK|nr:J domain-containing protein [Caballeronia insecticola]BAN24774.1 heat shock protein DnaJ domain protein [Caballeronia insecticola]
MATLYQTLGVDEHATEEEIKRAYRKAAMRCHPDRNAGNEDAARAKFQELKEAYAILSDPAQREVYDRIFAEEMQRWEARVRQEEAEREAREAKEREAREALYAERVSLAMRFASQGHNRDVVFGVLLGAQCDEATARQIADSAIALHESRQEREEREEEPLMEKKEAATADAANPLGAMWFQFLILNNLRL